MAAYQYIFVMQNLTKVLPGGRELFKDITLSFLPGAKIGVLGVNGAGKSTLLKIMAGVDKEFNGEAWAAEGVKVGYLEQEPKLDPSKNVMENVMDGLGETQELLRRFEEVSAKFAEPMSDDEMNDLITEQADLQEKIDAVNGWDIERTVQIAMDRSLALSSGRSRCYQTFRRRKTSRSSVSLAATKAGYVAVRRAYKPLGCRVGSLARTPLA